MNEDYYICIYSKETALCFLVYNLKSGDSAILHKSHLLSLILLILLTKRLHRIYSLNNLLINLISLGHSRLDVLPNHINLQMLCENLNKMSAFYSLIPFFIYAFFVATVKSCLLRRSYRQCVCR